MLPSQPGGPPWHRGFYLDTPWLLGHKMYTLLHLGRWMSLRQGSFCCIVYVKLLHQRPLKVWYFFVFFNIQVVLLNLKMLFQKLLSLNSKPSTTLKQSTIDFPKIWYFLGQISKNFPFHHHFRSGKTAAGPFGRDEKKIGHSHPLVLYHLPKVSSLEVWQFAPRNICRTPKRKGENRLPTANFRIVGL